MKKLNIKKYLSLGNIVCMIDDGVLSFIENSIRKETIESKINYLINSFSNKIIMSSGLAQITKKSSFFARLYIISNCLSTFGLLNLN